MPGYDYTPQNVGRRMRELENENVVEVRYEKNHAYYRYGAVAGVVGIRCGAISGNMKVSFQAARSIG